MHAHNTVGQVRGTPHKTTHKRGVIHCTASMRSQNNRHTHILTHTHIYTFALIITHTLKLTSILPLTLTLTLTLTFTHACTRAHTAQNTACSI